MKIKTLKDLSTEFESISSEQQRSLSGGTGIYAPGSFTYLGDMDFSNAGSITYFYDSDHSNNGADNLNYQYSNDPYAGISTGYADNYDGRYTLLYVTEDKQGYYVDNIDGGYFLSGYGQPGTGGGYDGPFQYIGTGYDETFGSYEEYYDQIGDGYSSGYTIIYI
jgi:hypothetical protein